MPRKQVKNGEPVLGLMVTSRVLHAVLVRLEGETPVVIQRFVRHRNVRNGAMSGALTPSMAALVPELQEEVSGNDFTIQFGEGSSSSDLFLRSEFNAQQNANPAGNDSQGNDNAASFMYELSEILDECRKLGHERLQLAFCAGSSEVAHMELLALEKDKKGSKKSAPGSNGVEEPARTAVKATRSISRDHLLDLLKEQYKGKVDEDCAAFLPMMPLESGAQRYLGLVPKPSEPVAVTLAAYRKQKDERPPSVRLLDSEASIYAGLARIMMRGAQQAVDHGDFTRSRSGRVDTGAVTGHTLLVRAGVEDTLLYFFDGEQLRHFESMRSLTAFDSPDTICSRVLLQQDEYGVEEVSRVYLLSEEREGEMIESFQTFFPEAEIRSLRETVPSISIHAAVELNFGAVIPAFGAALRLLELPQYRSAFEEVNLLPKRLVKQRIELPFTWHVLVMSVLLFCTALFFGARYVLMEQEIDEYRTILKQYPPVEINDDPQVLQARIDSMQAAYNQYMHALGVLDTLLMGSDKWSRGLEQLSRETAAVRGIWVESWTPEGGEVIVTGSSVGRDRVVNLAKRVEGNIQALTFSEIREWPVYSFSMKLPLRQDLPEAAKYLRERALNDQGSPDLSAAGSVPTGSAQPAR